MNFDFFKYRNKLKPERGRLLISEPFLPDPNFERTVVLLCEHNEDGSFGFILNKPSFVKVSEVVEDLKDFEHEAFVGGPVQQDTLHFLHRSTSIDEGNKIYNEITWGGNFEKVILLAETKQLKPSEIRFFLGYSGWSAGQLEEELKQDSWIVCDYISEELLFETEAGQMWKKALDGMGGRFSIYANYPQDPRLN
ncbi:MAG: YqgE/AlgH family protein [Flammeovirgaceae bacterium]|nr:YqgE/AlgH family protein [Flammeovirgaceae bacterium]